MSVVISLSSPTAVQFVVSCCSVVISFWKNCALFCTKCQMSVYWHVQVISCVSEDEIAMEEKGIITTPGFSRF